MTETIVYEVEHGVATITLNRPDKMNAITDDLVLGISERLRECATDNGVRAVVVTGAGRAFCAGGDLQRLLIPDQRPLDEAVASARRLMTVTELLRESPKPTIAAVNGACAGAGLSLACAADLRIAADTAVFAAAFVRAGRSGDYGLAWTLPRIAGDGHARRMLLLGERVDAATAVQMGLVSRSVPGEELREAAVEYARTIADLSPVAVRSMKANLTDAATLPLGDYLDREVPRHVHAGRSPEGVEAVSALVEKRRPSFALSPTSV